MEFGTIIIITIFAHRFHRAVFVHSSAVSQGAAFFYLVDFQAIKK
jgi:hypothetical protein